MADKELRINLTGDSKDLEKALSSAQQKLVAFSGKMKDIGKNLSFSLTAPLALAGGAAIKMASDFNESLNKVDVAFKQSSAEVKAFAKTSMTSFGIAEGSALDMASLFGDMATSMGLSTKEAATLSTSLVGLAGDLSSFKNIGIAEATTALNGVFTGETESLKRLGIVMTEANLKAYALTQGIKANYETMSQGEKVMLRYNYVMNATKNAQGDFERTQGGAANQMRIFQEGLKQLGTQLGQVVLPVVTKIVTALNGFIKYVSQADSGTQKFIVVLAGIAAAAGPMLFLAGTIIPKVITGLNLMTAAAVKFNITAGKGSALGILATMLGYAAVSAKDYSDALNPNNKLEDQEKNDAQAIRDKNKEILKSIKLLEYQKRQSKGPVTGMNAAAGIPVEFIEKQIAEQYNLIKQNNALIKEVEANAKKAEKANKINLPKFKFTGGSTKGTNKKSEAQIAAEKEAERIQSERTRAGEQARDEYEKYLGDINRENVKAAEEISTMYLSQKDREYMILEEGFAEQIALRERFGQSTVAITDKYRIEKKALDEKYDQLELERITAQGAEEEAAIQSQEETRLKNLQYFQEQIAQSYATLRDATASIFTDIGNSILNAFGPATTILEKVGMAIGKVLIQMGAMAIAEKLFGAQAIKSKQAQASADSIKVGTAAAVAAGPAGLALLAPFIASAMAMVSGAFATVPKFASGGIVSGPTMGLMGEYPGAKSNPEVIAPLNKLQSMINTGSGSNMNLSGEFIVRGQDLVLALQRAERQKSRIG